MDAKDKDGPGPQVSLTLELHDHSINGIFLGWKFCVAALTRYLTFLMTLLLNAFSICEQKNQISDHNVFENW